MDATTISDQTLEIVQITSVVLCGSLSIVGLIGNAFNLILFYRRGPLAESSTLTLFALALADSSCLLATVFISVLDIMILLNPDSICSVYIKIIASWLRASATNVARGLTTFIAFHRCMCVLVPLKAKTLFLVRKCLVVVVLITVSFAISFMPGFFSFRLTTDYDRTTNSSFLVVETDLDLLKITSVVNNGAIRIISLIIIFVCNSIIVYKVKMSKSWKESMTPGSKNARSFHSSANTKIKTSAPSKRARNNFRFESDSQAFASKLSSVNPGKLAKATGSSFCDLKSKRAQNSKILEIPAKSENTADDSQPANTKSCAVNYETKEACQAPNQRVSIPGEAQQIDRACDTSHEIKDKVAMNPSSVAETFDTNFSVTTSATRLSFFTTQLPHSAAKRLGLESYPVVSSVTAPKTTTLNKLLPPLTELTRPLGDEENGTVTKQQSALCEEPKPPTTDYDDSPSAAAIEDVAMNDSVLMEASEATKISSSIVEHRYSSEATVKDRGSAVAATETSAFPSSGATKEVRIASVDTMAKSPARNTNKYAAMPERRLIIMISIITTIYLLCNFLILLAITTLTIENIALDDDIAFVVIPVVNLIETFNSSINIIVYIKMSSKYRSELRDLLGEKIDGLQTGSKDQK